MHARLARPSYCWLLLVASLARASRLLDEERPHHRRLPARSEAPPSTMFAAAYEGGERGLQAALERQWSFRPTESADGSRFDALGPVVQCPERMLLAFGKGDDEKRVCGGGGGGGEAPCTVVSIGSNNQWGFERAVAAAMPACHIHTLDCTVEATVPPGLRDRVAFHSVCLGEKDATRAGSRYVAWATLVQELGIARPPAILKMDIEGFEWGVLESIVRSGSALLPFSISVELHVWTEVKEVPWQGRWRAPRETGAWMRGLLAHGGYALVDRHDNPMCSYCSEVVLARLLEPRPGPLSQSQRRSRLRSQRRRRMRQARNATFTEADEAPATFLSVKMHAGFAQQAA